MINNSINNINKCLPKSPQCVYWPAGIHVMPNDVGVKETEMAEHFSCCVKETISLQNSFL